MRLSKWIAALVLATAFYPAGAWAKAKQYQVTGTVLEANEQMIVIQKDDEKWEIDRTADTKIDGALKVGSKVTIHYHMVTDKVENKGAATGGTGGDKKAK